MLKFVNGNVHTYTHASVCIYYSYFESCDQLSIMTIHNYKRFVRLKKYVLKGNFKLSSNLLAIVKRQEYDRQCQYLVE